MPRLPPVTSAGHRTLTGNDTRRESLTPVPEPEETQRDRQDRQDRREREAAATQLAVATALEKQRVDLKLQEHDEAIRELRTGQTEMIAAMTVITKQLSRLETSMAEQLAAAKAVAAQSVSNRTLVLGVLAIVAAVIGSAIGHL